MNPRRQGDLGEASALDWLVQAGAEVFVPFGSATNYDLVADFGEGPQRVQVKTGTYFRDGWEVHLATRGGNQSWSGVAKLFSSSRCDHLLAVVGDGRRWFIPSAAITARHSIVLGRVKYAEFEVERGRPLAPSIATLRGLPAG